MLGRSVVTLLIPLIIIALAVPLILEKVPRNAFYGFRTPFTMSSDEIWYYANKISGIALLLGGIFWLLVGRILLAEMLDERSAIRLTNFLGAAALIAGCVVSYLLTRRKFRK